MVLEVREIELTSCSVQTRFAFPMSISYRAVVEARGVGDCGAAYLRVDVLQAAEDWQIHGFWWRCRGG
jgi:hypothetical protein